MKLRWNVVWPLLLQVVLHRLEGVESCMVNCSAHPLGMESSLIEDALILASSSDVTGPTTHARLRQNASVGWKPESVDAEPWIQVSLTSAVWLTGISTQAADSLAPPPEGVAFELELLVRADGNIWTRYPRLLSANYTEGGQIVKFEFHQSLPVLDVRLVLVTNRFLGLRMELYGCPEEPNTECALNADCNALSMCEHGHCACAVTESAVLSNRSTSCLECWSPLGLASGEIPDGQISASTTRSTGHHSNARLGNEGAWSPEDWDTAPWLMVQFSQTTKVTGMSTQGELLYYFGPNRDFIRTATIDYGTSAGNYTIQENGEPKVFILNSDELEIVTNIFPDPVETDFIKIVVVSPQASKLALRLELLGCHMQSGVPGTCVMDADCHQGPWAYDCIEQSCVPANAPTERSSTLAPTSAQSTTEEQTTTVALPTTQELSSTASTTLIPTTEQPSTEIPTTDPPTTTNQPTSTEPTTMVPTSTEPTTMVPTSTEPTTMVPTSTEPTTMVPTSTEPTTMVPTSTEPTTMVPTSTEPTTMVPTSTEPTTMVPTSTEPTSTAVPNSVLMTSSAVEIQDLYSTIPNATICLPTDSVSNTESSFTASLNTQTDLGQSQEFLDAFRWAVDLDALNEQDTAFLCSALSEGTDDLSTGLSDIGLDAILKVTTNRSEGIPSTNLLSTLNFLDSIANVDWDSAGATNSHATLEKMVNVGSNLLKSENENAWKETERVSSPFQMINSLEKMVLKVGTKLDPDTSIEVDSENIGLTLYDISPNDLLLSGWNWRSKDAKFAAAIAAEEFQKNNFSAYERALLVGGVFRNIAVLSPKDVPVDEMTMTTTDGQRLQSDVVTVLASSHDEISMSVSYSTPNDVGDVVIQDHEQPQFTCVFWEFNESSSTQGDGRWSDFGCVTMESDASTENAVSCFCNHTTNFAVLMRVVDKPVTPRADIHRDILMILTYTCSSLSILSLVVALAVLCYLGSSLASERLTIHKNLMLALLMAMMLFLLGVASDLDMIPCKIVAIVLHYLFLVVFSWILVEGVHLYRQVIAVFEQGSSKMPLYYLVGWGIPAIVVGISLAIKYKLYGLGAHCWLTARDGLIWAFVGPVILIITVNMVVLVMVVVVVTRAAALKCQTNLDRIRAASKSALMLVPLLGISWIIGLFTQYSLVLEYAFVLLNGLQGFFMFIFYCLLSSEVHTALRHEMKKRADRNMDSGGSIGKTNVWTLSSNKTTHVRLVKVAPSTHNTDDA